MLRYDRQTKPGLVALYDIRPGNGAGPFLQPRSPHGAVTRVTGQLTDRVTWVMGHKMQRQLRGVMEPVKRHVAMIVNQMEMGAALRSPTPGMCTRPVQDRYYRDLLFRNRVRCRRVRQPAEETETEALHYKTKAKTETSIGLDTEPKAL